MARPARLVFIGLAVAATALVLGGFARTFYLRHWYTPEGLSLLLLVHGLVMTSWFVILIAQALLAARGRIDLHMKLGYAGGAVAAAMVFLGFVVAIRAARQGMPLDFLATPLFDILVFAVVVAAALFLRERDSDSHKRLMLVATVAILPAAVSRLPVDLLAEPLGYFGLPDALLVLAALVDAVRNGRLHPAFAWGGLLLIASHPLRLALAATSTWHAFATWLIA